MANGTCQAVVRVGEQCQRNIVEAITRDMTLEGPDWQCCVMCTVGEALSNLVKKGQEGIVMWRHIERGLEVVIFSNSFRDHFESLSLTLGHVQACVDRGIGCEFIKDEHGLGHYLIAGLTSESCYNADGTLVLRYFADAPPKTNCLNLIDLLH